MLTAPKRLKLRTSNLTCVFPGTVRTWHPQIFPKRGVFKNLLGGDMHSHERLLVESVSELFLGQWKVPNVQWPRISDCWSGYMETARSTNCAAKLREYKDQHRWQIVDGGVRVWARSWMVSLGTVVSSQTTPIQYKNKYERWRLYNYCNVFNNTHRAFYLAANV